MPFNGSGTFSRNTGTYTGATAWQQEANAGNNIEAATFDTHDQDIATALSNCLCKDGQQTAAADQPMGGYKHTNVGNAAALNQYAALGQVQAGSAVYAAAGGSSNAYTISLSPAPTSYAAGEIIVFKANHTNSGAATVNKNSLGAKSLKRIDNKDLVAGDIIADAMYWAAYESSAGVYYLLNPSTVLMQNAKCVAFRNAANNAKIDAICVDGSDRTVVDSADQTFIKAASTKSVWIGPNAALQYEFSAAAFVSDISNVDLGSASKPWRSVIAALQSWTPTISGSGTIAISSQTNNQADYWRSGPYIEFEFSATFTITGSGQYLYVPHPVAGVAHSSACAFRCAGENGGGAAVEARWNYDAANTRILVFQEALANWTAGSNAAIHIQGRYRAV